ncbi:ABC transporter substrate-binding protein [Streptacidiphilus monticola]|jgi:polar amino acid transport system substrate-binding protein|uniref:ABC transporter substrate-binding protein n=1 Tax=Streptacidiphilus monticola TaxID=2161674 RepID=A0ABW1G985_9ACTN
MRRRTSLALLAAAPLFALTACGSGTSAATSADSALPAAGTDVVSGVQQDAAAVALLPAAVRQKGAVTVGSAVGAPPTAYIPAGSNQPAGFDIDIADAVGKVLGLRIDRQQAAFETILPALGSGKFDVGTGNFGVTTERLKTIDFVTYIDDGQGFAVKAGSSIKPVKAITDLCGLTIGTGAGTTFQATLAAHAKDCTAAGKKPYTVQAGSDTASILLGLQQGRYDVLMSTINGIRYQAKVNPQISFLSAYHRLDVGFAFAKGSPLTKAFQAAVNDLIKDGVYAKLLAKWGISDSAIAQSRISPPELAN